MSGGLGERAGGEDSSGNICSALRGIQESKWGSPRHTVVDICVADLGIHPPLPGPGDSSTLESESHYAAINKTSQARW